MSCNSKLRLLSIRFSTRILQRAFTRLQTSFMVMWDIKLVFLDFFFLVSFHLSAMLSLFLNFVSPLSQAGFNLILSKLFFFFNQNMTFFFSLKFCLCIGFLILIRGGAPRYRYDYLTKLGWLKFLGLVLTVFLLSLSFFFLF